MSYRRHFGVPLAAALAGILALSACAEDAGGGSGADYPSKPIDIIVPASAGGGADLITRALADALSKHFGQTINVVNKPGGNNIPGTQEALSAKPDGYTLLADGSSTSSLMKLVDNLPFKIEDRTFVAKATEAPMAYVASAKSGWATLDDVAAAAKADPSSFEWAALGGTTIADLSLVQFFDSIGVERSKTRMTRFPGTADAVTAIAGNHVSFGGGGANAMVSQASAGTVKVLAVTGAQRFAALSGVPTTAEAGHPELNATFWAGFSGPAGLPDSVVNAWGEALKVVLADPAVRQKLAAQGAVPALVTGPEFKSFVLAEADSVSKVMG
ncbi:tripartite tricarboxylate transporter substrate binding protein [Phytohabitans sp. ZYX-F-186]|uniref:Tripartite tricarboxylate transporter substrate binding protein n=1 Tax=Phytohabitans maris TaxID=3071409 RepID=A0ABU0ZSZ2_9ACTN|nr:tripartite tricarboxylate transporter substrate binding protein [Phytohabitans sp. ZYX-F-186]MDQ7909906.1 tripartite tricarboxylate transporter substrate binding protein [Phytohabitans sp. ZYX-F-186]